MILRILINGHTNTKIHDNTNHTNNDNDNENDNANKNDNEGIGRRGWRTPRPARRRLRRGCFFSRRAISSFKLSHRAISIIPFGGCSRASRPKVGANRLARGRSPEVGSRNFPPRARLIIAYIYIYIYMYVCMYVCILLYSTLSLYIYIYIYMYVCMYVYIIIVIIVIVGAGRMGARKGAGGRTPVSARGALSKSYVYTYIYIYVCIHIYIYIYMDMYMYIHVCVYIYIYIYIYICQPVPKLIKRFGSVRLGRFSSVSYRVGPRCIKSIISFYIMV